MERELVKFFIATLEGIKVLDVWDSEPGQDSSFGGRDRYELVEPQTLPERFFLAIDRGDYHFVGFGHPNQPVRFMGWISPKHLLSFDPNSPVISV